MTRNVTKCHVIKTGNKKKPKTKFTDRFSTLSTMTQTTAIRKKPSPLPKPRKNIHLSYMFLLSSPAARRLLCLGLEGSANKLGAGIISHTPSSRATSVRVLSNVRHTYITPPGEGFLPSDTARHHREWVITVIKEAVQKAGIRMEDLDVIAFTKGKSSLGIPFYQC